MAIKHAAVLMIHGIDDEQNSLDFSNCDAQLLN